MFNSAPDRLRGVDAELQLRALVGFGHRIAAHGAGEAALRADRQARHIDVLRRLVRTPAQIVELLELRRLRANEAEYDAFVPRDKTQRRKSTGARRIELEQEMIDLRTAEELL